LDLDGQYPIEKGDLIEKDLPDGSVEKYTVIIISFHEGNIDIPSHYSIEVRKESKYKHNISDEVSDKSNAEMDIRDINERFTTEQHVSQLQSISNQDIIELVYNFRELKKSIDNLDLPSDDKDIAKGYIAAANKEASKNEPDVSKIKDRFESAIDSLKSSGKAVEDESILFKTVSKIASILDVLL
jgi:uncharacterized protein YpuA (DUF1002 family)